MFQPEMQFENILDRMLSRIPDDFDKREGSIIYDALAPAALELESIYYALDAILQETFAKTSSREYLILRALERGLTPLPATKAVVKGVFNIEVPLEVRFKTSKGIIYTVKKLISEFEHSYELECEEFGEIGNVTNTDIIQVDFINGIKSSKITSIISYGREEESTEAFRKRYFDSFKEQAFGGNIADYKEKVRNIAGIGAVRVIPVWAGGGTVKLTILNTNFEQASQELILKVQNIIDPNTSGTGVGLAPIGHKVTVDTVDYVDITIGIKCVFENNKTFDNKKEAITKAINEYFENSKRKWDLEDISLKRIAIMSNILDIPDISDIPIFKINDQSNNLILAPNQIPKLVSVIEVDE